jgi:SHS2 domain-containing protein
MGQHYQLLDHTADLRIRVVAKHRADLYQHAGLALADLIAGAVTPQDRTMTSIQLTGTDAADLMVNFLRELLFLWTGDGQLVTAITIQKIEDTAVEAQVVTQPFDPDRHRIRHEIKAVTYHQIDVSRTADGWQATVIFDI